ncbi:MAG TPA: RES family NAD+ phosphorylase [Thermoanaerobaculia bacterium]|nr:RES family NAD+ phosphorylase [Thermoanaerobaculia bacterium]
MRCHDSRFGATEFNPGFGHGRFHPFTGDAGDRVPTLYGASTLEGALSESIFHNTPLRGPLRSIRRSVLRPMQISALAPRRALTLVQLHGFGLRRLGLSRADLIEAEAQHYTRTASWAAAFHAWSHGVDGLVWVSRLHDTAFALVLFGDRVARADLDIVEPPLPIFLGEGFSRVQDAAEKAGITILE